MLKPVPPLHFTSPLLQFIVFATATLSWAEEADRHVVPVGTNAWHVELWDEADVVIADYEGVVSRRELESGRALWSHSADGFVFDLKTGDLDGDGRLETAYVSAEGTLGVLEADGLLRWEFAPQTGQPLFNVVLANLTGDEALEVACGGIDRHVYVLDQYGERVAQSAEMERVIHRLAAGDLAGDGHDELLVIETRVIANAMEVRDGALRSLWRKRLEVPNEMINWENPGGSFFPFSLEIVDLDGVGRPELLMGDTYFNKQAVMVADHEGTPVWISERLHAFEMVDGSQTEFYSTAFVAAADLFSQYAGKEVVSVAGGMFRIWTAAGEPIGARNSPLGFSDLEILGRELILGSCPNGDESIYRMAIDEDWPESVDALGFKGLVSRIQEDSARLREQVLALPVEPSNGAHYDVITSFRSIAADESGLARHRREEAWFKERFPYDNMRIVRMLKVIEDEPVLDEHGELWFPWRWRTDSINGTHSVEEILEKARWVEAHRIPTIFYMGHSCMPFITLETAERILRAAPDYCVGFNSMEDEQVDLIPRYFEHYFRHLADLCREYGNKRYITKNKGLWWMTSPARPRVFEALFEGGRSAVSMAATEDSNSRTPEINLMARGGLWQAGLLSGNEVSIHRDLFSFNRFQQWEYPRVGHPFLRLLVAHATMGMTCVNERIRAIYDQGETLAFSPVGRESVEIFYHLLGKNIVYSPSREEAAGYSPIGLVMHQPKRKWLEDAHNGHSPEDWVDDPELHQAVLPHNGSLWGMTATPPHALTHVLFNKKRQFGYQVPPTPFGLVAIVPEQADLHDVAGVSEWWHTDGIYLWKEGQERLTGMAAAEALRADFEKAAERLPFRQVDAERAVFMNVLRRPGGGYRLFLVDPGWLDPEEHEVEIRIQVEGVSKVREVLTGTALEIEDGQFRVSVPAGLFSVVDVEA